MVKRGMQLFAVWDRYRSLVEGLGEGLVLLDSSGSLVEANPPARAVLGLAEGTEANLTEAGWDLLDASGAPLPATANPVLGVLGDGEPRRNVLLGLLRDAGRTDERAWVLLDSEPQLDEAGAVCGVVCTLRDVTEQQRSLDSIRQTERRLRVLHEGAAEMISLHTRSGEFIYASPAYARVLEVPPPALVGRSVYDFVHPADRAALARAHEQALAGSDTVTVSYRFGDPSGTGCRRVESSCCAVREDDGEVRELQVLTRDVTARHAVEQMLRLAMDAAPIGMAVVGLDGRLLRVNDALLEVTGWTQQQALTMGLLDLTRPADVAAELESFGLLVEGREPRWQVERAFTRADGDEAWLHMSLAVGRDDDGEPLYFLVHVLDVTQRHALTQGLARHALTDELTGLPNRRLLAERLSRELRRQERYGGAVAVAYVDLDDFKVVNDTHGHETGDALLRTVAARLRETVRAEDCLARLSGDEFVVAARVDSVDDAAKLGGRIRAALTGTVQIGRVEVRPRASVWLVLARPGEQAEEVLDRADAAMYAEKARRPITDPVQDCRPA